MSNDTWRDSEGFGRAVEVEPRVWSAKGPDNEDHAARCSFIFYRGILPCSCDATRKRHSDWWHRWMRWQQARSANIIRHQWPLKWPVDGPDGDPWVPGVDFNDDEVQA